VRGCADRFEADPLPLHHPGRIGLVDEGDAVTARDELPRQRQQRIEMARQRRRYRCEMHVAVSGT
jgi:hypothetical protein